MRVVQSAAELFAEPRGPRVLIDRRFLCWGDGADLGGHCVWGHPAEADAKRLVQVFEHALSQPHLHPRRIVADFRELLSIEPGAFETLKQYLSRHAARIRAIQIREAVLRPRGIVGSVVAGIYFVAPKPTASSRVFTDERAALRWLEREDAMPLLAHIDELRRLRADQTELIELLRARLREDLSDASLTTAARALHVAPRTLQRQLKSAGTSFRQELAAARLVRAQELLARDIKVVAVALELGFSSAPHFATWFKEQTGMAPSDWRARKIAGS